MGKGERLDDVVKVHLYPKNRNRFTLWPEYSERLATADALGSTIGKGLQSVAGGMAERVGFEPTIPLQVCRISSAVHSTTLPPLRGLGRRLFGAGVLITSK